MDVIWEALESLQSHFLGLHSSIVDSSSHCLIQKHKRSQNDFDKTYVTVNKVTGSTDFNEEHHIMNEDKTGMSHQTVCKTTQTSHSCSKSSHKKILLRNLSSSVYPLLSKSNSESYTCNHEPAYEASPKDRTVDRRTFFRSWREGCLCIGLGLLLLFLFLFLASCLLLVLPVVSVSVRTAGGLPAF